MTDEARIQELLEIMMEAQCTPEQACTKCPELLPEVRKRWHQLQYVEEQVGLFFRTSIRNADTDPAAVTEATRLPKIEGYDVQSVLGRGGMGVVYRARHVKLNRTIALKMLLSGAYAGLHELVRFQREAEAVASLSHPNIVQVFDVGELDGRPYFTMEFVDGKSLAEVLAGTPQPARQTAAFVATLADAIHVAHRSGIIHRDLKPANVLLAMDGTPKITDFGLARRIEGESDLTMTGARIGTPSYMAPEQAAGLTSSIGPLVDIYALGAILYEMLTGRPPFRAETAIETERQVIVEEPVSPSRLNPQVPRDLETICLKCLHKDPIRRYANAVELADDLRRFLEGQPVRARPISWVERVWRWGKRNRDVAAALSGVAVLLMLIVVGSLWAVAHFRKLEGEQRQLAKEKGDLADESEAQGKELRQNLYLTEMNLAGQAATLPGGLGRVGELLARWKHELPNLRNWEWYYLNGLSHRSLLTLVHHGHDVHHVAWSPNGTRLAAGGDDHAVCIWNVDDERPPVRLTGHTQLVFSVAWSPDGQRLASGSWDRTVRIWDTTSATELFCFRGHTASAYSVSWSPDGSMIASGGGDHTILIWDAEGGTIRHALNGHEGSVARLAWHPDGRRLASASHDNTVRIWDVTAGKPMHTLRGHGNWVNQVAWSPDGSRLASASNDETLCIWTLDNEPEWRLLRGHTRGVTSVDWSPDGTRLVSCSDDQTVRVWSVSTATELFSLRGHSGPLTTVAWNPKGDKLASAGYERYIKVWDASVGPETPALSDHVRPVESLAWCHHDPKLCASADASGEVKIWDLSKHSVSWSFRGDEDLIKSVAWCPNGTLLATTTKRGLIRIWNVATRREVRVLEGHEGEVYSVAWHPDSRRLASGGFDKKIVIWDVPSGEVSQVIKNHDHHVYCVAWSPDGRKLASASGDHTVKIHDATTGEEVQCYRRHMSHVVTVAWSPDGSKLASAGYDFSVQLWDAITGQRDSILRGHTTDIAQVIWSPDGGRVASAGRDGMVKVWDPKAGREALTLASHSGQVSAVAWSPDGLILASAGADSQIRIHNATPGYLAARTPEMLPVLERRLAADPSQSSDWQLRIETYARQHEWNQAAVNAREYLSLRPNQTWLVLDCVAAGPYSADLNKHCPPESEHYFAHEATDRHDNARPTQVSWTSVSDSAQGIVDFGTLTEHADHVSAYALFPIYSLDDRQIAILLGSDDQAQLWLNGERLYESLRPRHAVPDEDAISARLKSGWNALLVRVAKETGDHVLFLRLSDSPADMARARQSAK